MFSLIGNKNGSSYHYHQYFKIDEGGYGKVVYGLKNQNNKDELVAVKIFKKKFTTESANTEIQAYQNMQHKNVVDFLDMFIQPSEHPNEPPTIFLILELCNRGNLEYYVKFNDLSDLEIRFLFKQMVDGLFYIHNDTSYAHRDIKPNNFIFREDVLKIADFGEAKEEKNEKFGKCYITLKGTPLFINPQMVLHKYYSSKGDIFSLGVTLYYMYYKKTPWFKTDEEDFSIHYEKEMSEIYQRILKHDAIDQIFEIMPYVYVPDSAKDLIKNMLQYEEENRYNIIQVKNHPFMQFEKDGIKTPKQVKGFPMELVHCARSLVNEGEKKYKVLINLELEKQKNREIMERIYFEKDVVTFFHLCMKEFYDLCEFWPNKDSWINLLIVLNRFTFHKSQIFYQFLKKKKKHHLYNIEEWNSFYNSQNYSPTLEMIRNCYQTTKNNLKGILSKISNSNKINENFKEMVYTDYIPDNSFFTLLQTAAIENLKTLYPVFQDADIKKSKALIIAMHDLMIIATMKQFKIYDAKYSDKRFINFEKYHEDKNVENNILIMKNRLDFFKKSL